MAGREEAILAAAELNARIVAERAKNTALYMVKKAKADIEWDQAVPFEGFSKDTEASGLGINMLQPEPCVKCRSASNTTRLKASVAPPGSLVLCSSCEADAREQQLQAQATAESRRRQRVSRAGPRVPRKELDVLMKTMSPW